ncbi:MAG: acetolactate synthase small subunit [Nitrososphaeria archaeon]
MSGENAVIYSLMVENKPGVLFRVASQFRRRSFNIESVAVGVTERPDTSRMIITMRGDEQMAEDFARVLRRTVDVIDVSRMDPSRAAQRELALIRVKSGGVDVARGVGGEGELRVLGESGEGIVLQVVGSPSYVSSLIDALDRGKVLEEVARTGVVALEVS